MAISYGRGGSGSRTTGRERRRRKRLTRGLQARRRTQTRKSFEIHTKPHQLCVFITAGPITKLFARGGGGGWRVVDMC